MAGSLGKLVVRAYAPRKRALIIGAASFVAVLLLYGMFELGRYDAGYRVVDAVRGALSTSDRLRELESDNSRLRGLVEAADVARRVDREGYKQVERSLGDMQSQIARLNQDLSFYRGLVQPDSAVGVKVQRLQILPSAVAGQYQLKFVLIQSGKPDKAVAGSTAVSLDGLNQGRPASLAFARISPKARVSLAYSFRYFQDFDELLQLPPGFDPTRINMEIRSGRDASRSYKQAFVWKTQGVSVETEAKDGANVQAESD